MSVDEHGFVRFSAEPGSGRPSKSVLPPMVKAVQGWLGRYRAAEFRSWAGRATSGDDRSSDVEFAEDIENSSRFSHDAKRTTFSANLIHGIPVL